MPEATPPNPRTFEPHVGVRIGHGYDLHRLEPLGQAGTRDRLMLGGIQIESDRVPVAHSDGDALLHAITDAILGALAMPDIGQLFPDTDPRHAGEDSSVYLREAARRAASAGWSIANLDATVVLERPRIGPHKEAMRTRIAELVGITVDRVNVKGKTHERVDAVGEGRAVEVHVVAILTRS
ncbi:MAG: 2-C-methyl-D-erythritol 2,4-cyclodiphosphate synthase [Phycisphaeraceae bacterium]|nr:2-C-methyl-D-erythritol 2,4-cyclodiphosphate synthase [Phycisphaeraceae bacterium]